MPSKPPPPPPPSRRGSITGSHRVQRRSGVSYGAYVNAQPIDYEHFVRIDPSGQVISAQGSAQRLASLSAYASTLADMVGALLELGPVRSIEANFAGGTLLTVREPDGSLVGLKPYSNVAPAVRAARAQVGR